MSAVKNAEQKEKSEFIKKFYVGLEQFEVVAINPEKDKLAKLYGADEEKFKEPVYTKEDDDGNRQATITFYLKGTITGEIFRHSFMLTEKEVLSKKKDGEEQKRQYINQTGTTAYAEDEDSLVDWFKEFYEKNEDTGKWDKPTGIEKTYRKAYDGEGQLYDLLNTWLGTFNLKPGWSFDFKPKKWFGGVFGDLNAEVGGELAKKFVGLLYVKTDEADTEKQYQEIYKGAYLSGDAIKFINNGTDLSKTWVKNQYKKLVDNISEKTPDKKTGKMIDNPYPLKHFYKLEKVSEYNKEDNFAASPKAKKPVAADDDDY